MEVRDVVAVMVHVPDPEAAKAWYERAFPQARRVTTNDGTFEFLDLGPVQLDIVKADAKAGAGTGGTVVYWKVDDFDEALAHFEALDARLYRGPLLIDHGEAMCQVRDPWGNCIGLRGRKR